MEPSDGLPRGGDGRPGPTPRIVESKGGATSRTEPAQNEAAANAGPTGTTGTDFLAANPPAISKEYYSEVPPEYLEMAKAILAAHQPANDPNQPLLNLGGDWNLMKPGKRPMSVALTVTTPMEAGPDELMSNGPEGATAERSNPGEARRECEFSSGEFQNGEGVTGWLMRVDRCGWRGEGGWCRLRQRRCRWLEEEAGILGVLFRAGSVRGEGAGGDDMSQLLTSLHQEMVVMNKTVKSGFAAVQKDCSVMSATLEKVARGNAELRAAVSAPLANGTKEGSRAPRATSGSYDRLRWENGFEDIWLGGVHYNLRERNTARLCIQYLARKKAFDKASARHLEKEIDPYVRKHSKLPALPGSADGNLRIQHYFNDPDKKYDDLRRELVKAAGRNGCFYLQVK